MYDNFSNDEMNSTVPGFFLHFLSKEIWKVVHPFFFLFLFSFPVKNNEITFAGKEKLKFLCDVDFDIFSAAANFIGNVFIVMLLYEKKSK